MAVYDLSGALKEMPIYGSQRIEMVKALDAEGQFTHGNRQYEYSNHLGNVLAVSTDKMTTVGEHDDLISASNYYPFGLRIGDRSMNSGDYRYGFNGKEDDRDFSKSQLIQDYGFRLYNPALGKFLSVDPLTKSYPWYTPYQFAGNMPVWAIDLDGLEERIIITYHLDDGSTKLSTYQYGDKGFSEIKNAMWQYTTAENKDAFWTEGWNSYTMGMGYGGYDNQYNGPSKGALYVDSYQNGDQNTISYNPHWRDNSNPDFMYSALKLWDSPAMRAYTGDGLYYEVGVDMYSGAGASGSLGLFIPLHGPDFGKIALYADGGVGAGLDPASVSIGKVRLFIQVKHGISRLIIMLQEIDILVLLV